jgi:hypothetical protein
MILDCSVVCSNCRLISDVSLVGVNSVKLCPTEVAMRDFSSSGPEEAHSRSDSSNFCEATVVLEFLYWT